LGVFRLGGAMVSRPWPSPGWLSILYPSPSRQQEALPLIATIMPLVIY
jgi:hypothetical protein